MSHGDRGWGHRAGLGAVGAPGNVAPINGYGAAPEKFTLFVSNVPDTIDDYWLRKMFECVGSLLNITRPRDANGVPKAFGFADYADAESVLRCIEVLHDMRLPYKGGEKHLIVSPFCSLTALSAEAFSRRSKQTKRLDNASTYTNLNAFDRMQTRKLCRKLKTSSRPSWKTCKSLALNKPLPKPS
jgi:RNA-binding protein 25